MRKIIVSNLVSLDGYYTGPDNNVMVMPFDEAFNTYNTERLRAAETLLLGRTTFDEFRGYWPPVRDDPHADSTQRETSRLNSAIDKVVVSDSLTAEETAPWHNTEIVRRGEAHARLADLKRKSGKDILIFGSRTLWSDLMAHDLVDELHVMIGAGIVGAGVSMFAALPPGRFRLIDSRTWEGSGIVLARYDVRRAA